MRVLELRDEAAGLDAVVVIDHDLFPVSAGGTRMLPDVDVDEVARLARAMTWKFAACRVSYAGAKAGIRMQGAEVFKVAVNTLSRLVDETLEKNGIDKSQIDWLIPHQANLRIINAAAKKLDMPMDKVVVTVQDHGNTSAASIPLALDVAVRDGRIQRGQLLLMETFGGGFTWGSALVRY